MTVAYADIADVKTGRPEWVNLLIFVGAAIGTLTAITWIALVVADPH